MEPSVAIHRDGRGQLLNPTYHLSDLQSEPSDFKLLRENKQNPFQVQVLQFLPSEKVAMRSVVELVN